MTPSSFLSAAPTLLLVIGALGCGAVDNGASSAPPASASPEMGETAPEPSSAPVPPSAVAPTATAPSVVASASAAPTASASARPAAPPIVLEGVRRCTAEEEEREWCAQGKRPGLCRDGYCVSSASCLRYCEAFARSEQSCDAAPDPACAKIPQCVKDTKGSHDACLVVQKLSKDQCVSGLCEELKRMPPPPTDR